MRGEIIAAMAADMNIKKFNNETDLQFVQRVLYSATACWVKAAALDRNIGDENVDTGVSKKHIYEKVGFTETDVVDEDDCHEVNMVYYC